MDLTIHTVILFFPLKLIDFPAINSCTRFLKVLFFHNIYANR